MEAVETITIPEAHIKFAEEVTALAEANGIKQFKLEYDPHHLEGSWDHRIRGNAIITYSAKDGRGRPCKNLGIHIETAITHKIVSTPSSY